MLLVSILYSYGSSNLYKFKYILEETYLKHIKMFTFET